MSLDNYRSPFAPNIKQSIPKKKPAAKKNTYTSPFAPGITQHLPQSPQGSGAGATPPAQTATPPVTLDGDPGIMGAEDAATRATGYANANLLYTLGGLGSSYGFDATGGVDPNNPYSQAALLLESHKRQNRANLNSYSAEGQLYSGAYNRAKDESVRNYAIGDDRMRKSYANDQFRALEQWVKTITDAGGTVDDATFNALLEKIKPPEFKKAGK